MSQCVIADKIVCWDRMRNNWLDEAGVHAKFGVGPSAIADYLALVGDSADGIPGVPRWGAKSASQLLAKHGSITAIPDDPAAWGVSVRGAAALATSLNDNRRQAALWKTLATLRTDVPLGESLDDLEWRGADRAKLTSLCDELDDGFAIERVTRYRAES
jgi:5'-3' exonuclease